MKNICVAINTIVKHSQVSLKSIYETHAMNGDTYLCKSGGIIYYCLVFVVKGKLLLQTSNNLKIAVEENHATFVLSSEIKSYKCLKDDTVYYWLYFSYDGSFLPVNYTYEVDNAQDIIEGFDNCCSLLNQQNDASLLKANMIFTKHFLEGYQKSLLAVGDTKIANIGISNSIDFIHENLFHLPIIEDIAEMFGMSNKKFREDFEKATGLTPSKYIKEKKLLLTKSYLNNTNLTLSEIAELLEFSSPYYLSKCFKERFNITPKDYRAKKESK